MCAAFWHCFCRIIYIEIGKYQIAFIQYIAGDNNMEKVLIVLSILLLTNSCITVVFEPYMGDKQKGKS